MSSDAAHPPVTDWRQIVRIVGAALLTTVALVPVSLGFLAGLAFWALRWLYAAAVVGFHAGNASAVEPSASEADA